CQTVPEGWGRPAQRLHTKWAPLDSCWCPFALQPLHDQVLSAAMAPNTRCTLDPDVDVGVIRLSSLMTSHGRADSMPLARIGPPKAQQPILVSAVHQLLRSSPRSDYPIRR
ncbi:unnamed protein product, partial [Ascophyllum nodosum]